MAAGLFDPREIKRTVDRCKIAANTMPDATRAAAGSVGMEIKTSWIGVATRKGATPGKTIGGRKWNVGYNVMGGTGATVKVEYRGPIHLLYFPWGGHVIGAKLLGTRSAIRNRSKKLSAEGVGNKLNRGTFGAKQINVNYNRYGSIRQQAKTGTLRRREGKHALTIGGGLYAYAFHPGTRGKPTAWPESKAAALRIAPTGYGYAIRGELARSFGQQANDAIKSKGMF